MSRYLSIQAILIRACFFLLILTNVVTPAFADIPIYTYIVKNTYPHDPDAFTEGLYFKDGFLYESSGLQGHSSIRRIDLETGKVLEKQDIPPEYFGEGIAPIGNEIIELTWQSQVGFVLDAKTFQFKRKFTYEGEGWGLTSHKGLIYMSDGTSSIRVINAKTLKEIRRIQVTAEGRPIPKLNELEWIDGELFANIFQTNFIARIDPVSGHVIGWIDLKGLQNPNWQVNEQNDVLNGIAFDSKNHRIFVTGKHWPNLFEIELVEVANP